ncbi:hypothetical protein, partial [Gilliamella sp. wkB112]|uniref:hypothetical protein n=1 Tax=Gilliamella sp. wkB112 TaxID=3120257 RepID=UPI0011461781
MILRYIYATISNKETRKQGLDQPNFLNSFFYNLFKFSSLLFIKFFLRKIRFKFCVFNLVLLLFPFFCSALTAVTKNPINGSLPYLTFNDGVTREVTATALGLIRITLPDGTSLIPTQHDVYPDSIVDTSSADDPIILKTSDTFDSIKTYVPFPSEGNTNYPKVDFDQLLVAPYNYWQDDDGDELIPASSPQAKGSLTVVWKDKYGRDITNRIKSNPSAKLSSCEAPYSLTVGLNKGEIRTKYGIPSKFTIDNNNHTYYIYPKPTEPIFCYAQPNLTHGDGQYAGPEDQWDPKNGFKLQDVNTPESNFPTVGGNNLFFKLIVDGITAEKIINTNGAIVQPEVGEGVSLELTAENNEPQGKVVRV